MNDEKKPILEYPCDIDVKVMGRANNDDNFEQEIISIFQKHFPDVTEKDCRKRPSKQGNFLSLTIQVKAQSREQIDALYQELTKHKLVILAL